MRSARTLVFGYPPSGGLAAISSVPPAPPPPALTFYVDPAGSATNDGSITHPWDLQTALNQPAAVLPGSTIWLRGGTYTGQFNSQLTGTVAAPIVMRQYPSERATIDGSLLVYRGAYTTFLGFEVMNSAPVGGSVGGVDVKATGTRLINLVIHDASWSGIGLWHEAVGGDVYGCVIYNNGTHYNLDHGIYTNNTSGTKTITNNVIFNNWTYGIQVQGSPGTLNSFQVEGNALFHNATTSSPTNTGAGIIVDGGGAQDISITNNYTYQSQLVSSNNWAARLGVYGDGNDRLTLTNNLLLNFTQFGVWGTTSIVGNTFYSPTIMLSTTGALGGFTWATNLHYHNPSDAAWGTADVANFTTFTAWRTATGLGGSDTNPAFAPTGSWVAVRPNAYEAGRANIIVYNWDHAAAIAVDLSSVLTVGQAYKIVNVQDFFGTPTTSGTYAGGTVNIPMAGIPGPIPIGRAYTTPPVTGPEFQVFVVRLQGA